MRFARSVQKPGRASRRLHAEIRASPELIPEEGSPPLLASPDPLSTPMHRFALSPLSTVPVRIIVPTRLRAVLRPSTRPWRPELRLVDSGKSIDEIAVEMRRMFPTATAADCQRAMRIGLERFEILEEGHAASG